MKRLIAIAALASAATAGAQTTPTIELGLTGGYYNGLSGGLFIHSPNLIGPAGVKIGVSYSSLMNPINEDVDYGGSGLTLVEAYALGGYTRNELTESGSALVVNLDGTYGLGELAPGLESTLYAGGRYGMFNARSGVSVANRPGNIAFSTNSFGVGAGVMFGYALTGNVALVADLGVDTFFRSTVNVVSTTDAGVRSTDTVRTNDAQYSGFSGVFNRPGTAFKARIGIKTTF